MEFILLPSTSLFLGHHSGQAPSALNALSGHTTAMSHCAMMAQPTGYDGLHADGVAYGGQAWLAAA